MDEAPTSSSHRIAIGDRGTVPVTVMKDYGDVIQVQNTASGIGGGTIRSLFWVKRTDFVPAPPLAP